MKKIARKSNLLNPYSAALKLSKPQISLTNCINPDKT